MADIKFSSTTFTYEGEVEIRLEWLGQDLSDARIERIESLWGYHKNDTNGLDLSGSSINAPSTLERLIVKLGYDLYDFLVYAAEERNADAITEAYAEATEVRMNPYLDAQLDKLFNNKKAS